jgi:hypothetical protein
MMVELYRQTADDLLLKCLGYDQARFNFVLDDGELYRHATDDILLKCLGPDQARLAMVEVHEGVCGTHQSAPKVKCLLRRACFY